MKKQLITLAVVALTIPVWAQQTREINPPTPGQDGEKNERGYKQRRERSAEEKAANEERRLQIMEKTLKNIGVSEEQKTRIFDLQKKLREQMLFSYRRIEAKKLILAELEKSGATEEKIYAAIDDVSDAQAEQMKILARNRMQMERILGKEKFKLFMDSARNKWREHGRRDGSGMPKRPGLPPVPGNQKNPPQPPRTSGGPPTP